MNVIDNIVQNKFEQLIIKKDEKSLETIKKEAMDKVSTKKSHVFYDKLRKGNNTKLIAEYKPASPSQGKINDTDVKTVINNYANEEVDLISVLTEETYFNSCLENLVKAKQITSIPILRKDFLIDEYMIYESALYGADCILLINNIYSDIEKGLEICNNLGIDAIVECHTLDDLLSIKDFGAKIIGINNRNLENFSVNLETTKKLHEFIPDDVYCVSESGVKTSADAYTLKEYGANALLIGTSLLKKKGTSEQSKFIQELKRILK